MTADEGGMRVRFAPSPTGYLHVGGARTALFNWFLARQRGGTFVLRIEDTDRERSSDEHTKAILDGMGWLGLDVDEGPHFQSEGLERHRADALRLLGSGDAYRDFTDPAALKAEARERGMEDATRLAREKADAMGPAEQERRAAAGEPSAVRFRVPDGQTVVDDLVHGHVTFANEDIEDLVILRSDGSPTYNMAVVSDDAHMRVTHVLRGDDHLSNTPKQVLLYRALGFDEPRFGHLPMILGADGKRLSKRHGATSVGAYEEAGILPAALVNFLALLGWNPGDEREVMSIEELTAAFSLDRVQKKSAVFDTEKLEWLNGQHLAMAEAKELTPLIRPHLAAHGLEPSDPGVPEEDLRRLVELFKVRGRTLVGVAGQMVPYLRETVELEEKAVAKHWGRDPRGARERLAAVRKRLAEGDWKESALETRLRELAGELEVGFGKLIPPLRVALTGSQHSPGIFDVLLVLGRERSLARVDRALERLARMVNEALGEGNI